MQSTSMAAGNSVQYATVPNAISLTRLLLAPVTIVFAMQAWETAFLALAIALLLTDWIDGRIARAWNQVSNFGARLDAASDVTIYVCIAIGVWLLQPMVFWDMRYGLAVVLASYLLSLVVCLIKFGCLPNYHTRLSKLSWLLVTVGVIALLLKVSVWPLWIAYAVVTAANFESMAVTVALRRWRSDVRSVQEALRLNKQANEPERRSSAINELP